MPLPTAFLRIPLAHRGLHDIAHGIPENSRAAVRAAIDKGYGIEVDVQPSSCGEPMVFHDYALGRLTGETGPVAARTREELGAIGLVGGKEGIPTLREILEIVDGRVPILIEMKDQDGGLGENVGDLPRRVAEALEGYEGPVAVMSFNPHMIAEFARHAPGIPRGLVTMDFTRQEAWPLVPSARREELTDLPDLDALGIDFVSHGREDLSQSELERVRARGLPILTWTVHSPEEEAEARKVADNITFEGYLPVIPLPAEEPAADVRPNG